MNYLDELLFRLSNLLRTLKKEDSLLWGLLMGEEESDVDPVHVVRFVRDTWLRERPDKCVGTLKQLVKYTHTDKSKLHTPVFPVPCSIIINILNKYEQGRYNMQEFAHLYA
jgi:hypothetical protein